MAMKMEVTLKMEAAKSAETLVTYRNITRYHINKEQIEFGECLLPFSSASFVFPFPI